jgi:tetratricopeptide (TPR) repeat protein
MYRLILVVVFLSSFLNAQNERDEVWRVWNSTEYSDSIRHLKFADFIWDEYMFSNVDSALVLARIQYQDAKELESDYFLGDVLNTIATAYYLKGDYIKGVKFYEKALAHFVKLKNLRGQSNCLNNIGLIHSDQGNYAEAITYYTRSLKIDEKHNDSKGVAASLNNIGLLYKRLGDVDAAIIHYNKSIELKKKLKDSLGVVATLSNLGVIYQENNEWDKAEEIFLECLKIEKQYGDLRGVAGSYINLGTVESSKGDSKRAHDYFVESLRIYEEIGDKRGVANSLTYIAESLFHSGAQKQAFDYAEKAFGIALELGSLPEVSAVSKLLYDNYKKAGNSTKALLMHEHYISSRDSIQRLENKNELIKHKFQYEYEKKAAADSIAFLKEEKIRKAELSKKEVELRINRQQKIALYGGVFLLLIFVFFILNRFKITQKQKVIIEEQKEKLELKQQETTASIVYAQRLQQAILPAKSALKTALKRGFVIYLPKDIVAGDFYWMESYKDKVYFAVADCTGHGVPGAMMSVICSNALSKALLEEKNERPDEILNLTRDLVIRRLAKSGETVNDGMDLALISIDFYHVNPILNYAGANCPLWIIRKNEEQKENKKCELIEIKPDKQPIGNYSAQNMFTNHVIELRRGDRIYMFSDGYADQFGGETENDRLNGGKKLKSLNFKRLLCDSHQLSMEEQKEYLESYFNEWKGNLEQVDDVCVIGLEIV